MPYQTQAFEDQIAPTPGATVVRDPDTFMQMMCILHASPAFAFDTETSGLAWWAHARMCGIGFATRVDVVLRAWYVPVRHYTGERQLDYTVIAQPIKQLLGSPHQLKVAHHLKFDEHIVRREGWIVGGPRYDTMIAARLFDENRALALKSRALEDLGYVDAHEMESKITREVAKLAKNARAGIEVYRNQYGYSQLPVNLCGVYACKDVQYTWELFEKYEHWGVSRNYPRIWNTEMRLTEVLCDMEEHGMPVDPQYLDMLHDVTGAKMAGLEDQLQHVLGPDMFKLGSDDDLRRFMVDGLHLPLYRRTKHKQLCVDDDVLVEFAPHDRTGALALVRDWREARKIHSTYTVAIKEKLDSRNMLHGGFNQAGTNCMPAGELVLTARGYLPVERVKAGDTVLTHEGRPGVVSDLTMHVPTEIVRVVLSNGLMLRTTPNHLYQCVGGNWKAAGSLQGGDCVRVHSDIEQWRKISGWKKYEVSSWGRVRNVETRTIRALARKGKWGHLKVCLSRNGAQKRGIDRKDFTVHRLVALAFLGKPKPGQEVRHRNGFAWDNTVGNLTWGSSRDNSLDAVVQGMMDRRHGGQAKLTDERAALLRYTPRSVLSDSAAAKAFGVSRELVRDVRMGKRWCPKLVGTKAAQFHSAVVSLVARMPKELVLGLTVAVDHSHVTGGIVTHNTGRLSASDPNLQNFSQDNDARALASSGKLLKDGGTDPWSVRRAFVVQPGVVRLIMDYCLAPETKVETINGLRELSSLRVGDKVYTWRDGKIAWGEVSASASVGLLPSYRLTFDNGQSVIASKDHKWPVRSQCPSDGRKWEWSVKRTEELLVSMRMTPMKRCIGAGYTHLYSASAYKYTKEHVLVAEAVLGPKPDGAEIHHRNGDKLCNSPENLEYKITASHRSVHGKKNDLNQDHTLRVLRLREALKVRRSYDGEGNPNFGRKKGVPATCLSCGSTFYRPPSHAAKYCSHACYSRDRWGNNHQLASAEFIGLYPAHAITVEPDHNFVLGCGVVTMNSQIELRVLAYYSRDPIMVKNYLEGGDIHKRTADEVGVPRKTAKIINFGLCLLGGQKVLTKQDGLVPIEAVRNRHLVWDGVEWVSHGGLVCRGEQEVMTYDGITATSGHGVYTEAGELETIGQLASCFYPRHIAVGAIGEDPVRYDAFDWKYPVAESGKCWAPDAGGGGGVLFLQENSMGVGREHFAGSEQGLLLSTGQVPRSACKDAWRALRLYGAAVQARYSCFIEELQRAWNQGFVQVPGALYSVGVSDLSRFGLQAGLRPDQQRRGLLSRELAFGNAVGKCSQWPKVAKVYDLLNAGPRRRFTVEGKIVSNSYGLTAVGMARQVGIAVSEAERFMETFFQRYAGITAFKQNFWNQVRMNNGQFSNLFGRTRRVPAINSAWDWERGRAERQAIATLIQGTAAELTKESLVRIHGWLKAEKLPAFLTSTVHDELWIDTDVDCLAHVARNAKNMMEDYPEFSPIPITVSGAYTVTNWAEKKEAF